MNMMKCLEKLSKKTIGRTEANMRVHGRTKTTGNTNGIGKTIGRKKNIGRRWSRGKRPGPSVFFERQEEC